MEYLQSIGKPVKGFEHFYSILEDGTIRNEWNNHILKPDKHGCVCFHIRNSRKTLSIARLMAIHYLDMPDDKKHCAFKKDPNKGFDVSNIAWDTLANHNKDRLTRARAIKADHELLNKQSEEEELYEELINDD